MTTFTKHLDQPLTYEFSLEQELLASYSFDNLVYTPNISENSAQITLNLTWVSNTPSTFTHLFYGIFNELNGEENITISISTTDGGNNTLIHQEGIILTHQESGTIIEKPFKNS